MVSLLTNLLILPVQPPIMIVGGLATLAGMIWLPLAWSVWMVELTPPLPFASLDLGTFPLWLLMLMYAAIAAGIWAANRPVLEEKDKKLHKPYNRTWKIYPRRRLLEMSAG